MSEMIEYLLQRLNEPSTWRGIIVILTGLGVALDPSQIEAIVATGLTIAGLIGAFTKDKIEPKKGKPEDSV